MMIGDRKESSSLCFQAVIYRCEVVPWVVESLPIFGGNIAILVTNMMIVPVGLIILIPANIAIIIKVIQLHFRRKRMTSRNTDDKKTIQMTMMILSVPVSYVIINLPYMLYYILGGQITHIHPAIHLCPFLNAMINAFLYFFSGSVFTLIPYLIAHLEK